VEVVKNQSAFPAPTSRTRHYLSVDRDRNAGDKLVPGVRTVPALGPGLDSTGTVKVTIPNTAIPGVYYLLACADDLGAVPESDETNNCVASPAQVEIGRPDLTTTAISSTAVTAPRGGTISVTDTVKNAGPVAAGTSRVRYYLSPDPVKGSPDRLLSGYRVVPGLTAGEESTGTIAVKLPGTMYVGLYFLLACADASSTVTETDEGNNCRVAASQITVTQ
jgi:subtilase family serine protease